MNKKALECHNVSLYLYDFYYDPGENLVPKITYIQLIYL